MSYRMQCVLFLVVCGFSLPVVATESTQTEQTRTQVLPAIDEASQQTPRSNRLRFRTGTVCMCAESMTEADIQRAQERRERSRRARE